LEEFLRHGFEVLGGEDGIRGEVGELAGLDDVATGVASGVGFEVGLEGWDGLDFVRLVVGNELGEFLCEQVVLRLEARDPITLDGFIAALTV